jgi:hypothetical protein
MAKVKVRIAVAVGPNGEWNAMGWSSGEASDSEKMSLCVEPIDPGEARYWLEAELDVPEEPTVQASVTAA